VDRWQILPRRRIVEGQRQGGENKEDAARSVRMSERAASSLFSLAALPAGVPVPVAGLRWVARRDVLVVQRGAGDEEEGDGPRAAGGGLPRRIAASNGGMSSPRTSGLPRATPRGQPAGVFGYSG